MRNIKERLDKLRKLVQDQDFLEGKGLSNEVNIRIFCYEAAEEMIVRHFIEQITTDQTLGCHLIECNLYEAFLGICSDMDILDTIPEMENTDGSVFLLDQLHSAISESEFIEKIQEKGSSKKGDVLLLTGVGDVFPFMRVHKMLEALQPYYSDIPILVMYPGAFDGNYLKLFDRLTPNPYYRAFNVI
jgi:hypothetical protein